jgi:uncharacterized protein YaaN involved in tellurite resistance
MSDVMAKQNDNVVDITNLDETAQGRARDLANGIDITDSQAVVQYGVGAQANISSFADTILTEIRAKDTGYVGEQLSELVVSIKDVDVGGLSSDGGALSKLFGGIKRRIKKFIAGYQKLSTHIDNIVQQLDSSRMTLLKDISMLDNLFEKNVEYLKDLDIYIAAGQLKIEEIQKTVIPELQKKAQESGDPMDAQKLQDMNQLLNRFEKKIHDMLLSRMIAIQTSPQIRLIQGNNQTLVEKIQSSILNTIPLWKNQIIIAISLFRQKEALEVQKQVTDTTNDLLARNSQMLKDSSLEVARESERGIVEIETLKKVNDDLISTIEETLKIQQEGRQKRAQAEQELVKMEGELKTRLASVQTPGA